MVGEKQRNTTHFLTSRQSLESRPGKVPEDEEFDENDVFWSDNSHNDDPNNDTEVVHTPRVSSPHGYTAGISAALLADSQSCSPTSIQRKMSSSPVAMISSSYLARNSGRVDGDGGGGGGGTMFGSPRFHMSAPVNVPVWSNNRTKFGVWVDDDADGDMEDDKEMMPPHEIVARSRKTTAFSVVEGAGRTLKGRDLTKVRNAVFHKTGFLD